MRTPWVVNEEKDGELTVLELGALGVDLEHGDLGIAQGLDGGQTVLLLLLVAIAEAVVGASVVRYRKERLREGEPYQEYLRFGPRVMTKNSVGTS